MTNLFHLAALPLLLAIVTGTTMTTQASADSGCEIRAEKVSGGVRLQAVAFSSTAAAGDYEFVVAKSGGGGTSNTSQSGDFESGAAAESVLSEVTLGGGGSYEARLTVTWADGASCTDRYPRKA